MKQAGPIFTGKVIAGGVMALREEMCPSEYDPEDFDYKAEVFNQMVLAVNSLGQEDATIKIHGVEMRRESGHNAEIWLHVEIWDGWGFDLCKRLLQITGWELGDEGHYFTDVEWMTLEWKGASTAENASQTPVPSGPSEHAPREGSPEAGEKWCRAGKDGHCTWGECPQLRDNEPEASGRSCPLPWCDDEY